MRLFTLFMLVGATASAQHIEFPLDTKTVTVDGVLQQSEWQHAKVAIIKTGAADSVEVRYKHDGQAIYFAFTGKLESASALFPEVLTDAANTGGNSWVNGQWWFHVSATDCDNNGGYGVYANCKATQPDWEGGPNFSAGAPMTDTVEIKIPFSKTGFNPATMDTMGISFMVTNTANIFQMFPAAADRNKPATWAKATFSKIPSAVPPVTNGRDIIVYPVPAHDVLNIKFSDDVEESTIEIYSLTGSRIFHKDYTGNRGNLYTIRLDDVTSGIYALIINTGNDVLTTRLTVQH